MLLEKKSLPIKTSPSGEPGPAPERPRARNRFSKGRRISRKRSLTPLEYTKKRWFQATMWINLVFLYFPIITLIAFSFNNSRRNIVWRGFTLKYYVKAYNNATLFDAVINTLIVAGISTVISTILGAFLGLALSRFKWRGKSFYDSWIHLPIIIPEICMGVAMMAFFHTVNISLGLFTITVSHIAFTIPFVAIVIRARMAGFDFSLEEASRDLGASQFQTFMHVTLPYMVPGIIAGALLAMTLSLDDFVITFFTSGPGSTTLPVKIFSMIRFNVSPEVNAASTVLITVTLVLAASMMILQTKLKNK